jgi:hypothetical protein
LISTNTEIAARNPLGNPAISGHIALFAALLAQAGCCGIEHARDMEIANPTRQEKPGATRG